MNIPLSEIVQNYLANERVDGNILDEAAILGQALAALRFYAAYALLFAHRDLPKDEKPSIDQNTTVTISEWAIIRGLFLLYVERETALQLEASRALGMDVFGRASSEIANDIAKMEESLPKQAFHFPMTTI